MQRAINMHNSQISHGVVEAADFLNDALNRITTGYTPSMIKIYALDNANDPVANYAWFSTLPDLIFTGLGGLASFVATTDKGFVVDGLSLVTLEINVVAFIWEAYGCDNAGDYHDPMNGEPVDGGNAMPQIDPYLPEIQGGVLSEITDIKVNTLAPDFVTAIDNTLQTMTVAAATTVAQLLGEIESTDGSTQTYNVFDDDGLGAPDLTDELTGATALTSNDFLRVTAENGIAVVFYEITVSGV